MESVDLAGIFLKRWQGIRAMTYDCIDMLRPSDLGLRLPFPESQSIGDQFWCMLGAQESYLKEFEAGAWQGFSSSMATLDQPTPDAIKFLMQRADAKMEALMRTTDLFSRLANGMMRYELVQLMLEHEMHHQGQLINLMFCHHLAIPPSWHNKWALAYDG